MNQIFLYILTTFLLESVNATVIINKRDLKLFDMLPLRTISNVQKPTRTQQLESSSTKIKLFIDKNNKLEALDLQPFLLPSCSEQEWKSLNTQNPNKHFEVRNDQGLYVLHSEIKCGTENHLIFKSNSPEGELISIWNILFLAEKFFSNIHRLEFWQKKITVLWPSDGDYFSDGFYTDKVNITQGHHWDVVAHELGHAIYHQAQIGDSVGGAHKIDECYNSPLALSEGWATFFAAWLMLDINHNDPKFEYLVPRRAPIQIENVPQDVCRGVNNEWRVASYLWDVVDAHKDIHGEELQISSERLWDQFKDKKFRSIVDFKDDFEKNNPNKSINDVLWNLNF